MEITLAGSRSETRVAAPSGATPFKLKGHRQRVRADGEVGVAVLVEVPFGPGALAQDSQRRVRHHLVLKRPEYLLP